MKLNLSILVQSFILVFLLTMAVSAYGAYLENHSTTLENPDGSKLECFVTGDEFARVVHDQDGFSILRHPRTGYAVYAVNSADGVVASEHRVGVTDPKTLGIEPKLHQAQRGLKAEIERENRLRMEYRTSPLGQLNSLVVLVRFNDQLSEPNVFTQTQLDSRFNLATGPSLNHYYNEVSNAQLNIDSFIYPSVPPGQALTWATIDQPRAYFSPYHEVTNPIGYLNTDTYNQGAARKRELFTFALNYLDTMVPTDIDLDSDNDGAVDGVTLIVKGAPDSWGEVLWPTASSSSASFGSINGLPVHRVILNLENLLSVNVVCHEMGHQIGAPDFYHYTEVEPWASIKPTHLWEMMSNNAGHWLTHNKMKYGQWFSEIPQIPLTPTPTTYTLPAIDTSPYSSYKVQSSVPGQYYVLEYRRQSGLYESQIPGTGLIVYRIIEGVHGNAGGPPDEVYIFRPGDSVTTNGNPLQAHLSSQSGRTNLISGSNHQPWLWADTLSVIPGNLVVSNVGASGADQISFELSLNTADGVYWTGTQGTSWHNPANWTSGAVPTANDDVVIPANLSTYPTLSGGYGTCRDLRIEHSARISLNNDPLFVYQNADVLGAIVFSNTSSALNVAGNLSFWSASQISRLLGGGAISVGGNLRFESGSDIRIPGSALQLSGTNSSQLINHSSATELGFLQINKADGASVTLSEQSTAGIKIMNDFTLPSGQSLTCENEQITQFFGNITDQNTSAYRGLKFNDGVARMAGTNQSITFSSTNSYFYHLEVVSSQSTSLLSNMRVKGELKIFGTCALSIGANNLTVDNDAYIIGDLRMDSAASTLTAKGDIFWQLGATVSQMHAEANILCVGNMSFAAQSNIQLTTGTITCYGTRGTYIKNYSTNTRLNHLVSNKVSPNATAFYEGSTLALRINGNLTNTAGSRLNNFYNGNLILMGNLTDENTVSSGITWDIGTLLMQGANQTISLQHPNDYIHRLRIQSTGPVSLAQALRITDNFELISGSFAPGSNPVYVQGDWTVPSGATFNAANSTVYFDGSGDQNVTGALFNTLRLAKSTGNLIFSSGTTIVNSFKYDLGTLVLNGAILYLDDLADYSIQGNYVVQSGELHFIQDASSHLDLDCNLTISGGTVKLVGGINQPIELAYSRHTTLTISEGTLDFGAHDILIANTGYNLNLNISGGLIRANGNVQITRPNVQFPGGTFEQYGLADHSIQMSNGSSFYNFKINKFVNRGERALTRSHTTQMNSNLWVENDLILCWGYLSVNEYQLSVGQNLYTENLSGLIMDDPASAVIVNGDLAWGSDAISDLQNGYLLVNGNWTQHSQASISYGAQHVCSFVGYGNSVISSDANTLDFGKLLVDKANAEVSLGSSLQSLNISGFLQVDEDSNFHFGTCSATISGTFVLNGSISGAEGGSVSCQDLTLNGAVFLDSGFTVTTTNLELNGSLQLDGGDMIVSNDFVQNAAAALTINSGQFILDKAYTGAMFPFAGTVNLNGGYFQVTSNGILLGPDSQLSHNAGGLRIGWNFEVMGSGVFQPLQGAVEFIGNRHSFITLAPGNHFYDLMVNKGANSYGVYVMNNLDVNNDLYISQGNFVLGGRTLNIARNLMLEGGLLYADQASDVLNVGKNWSNSAGITAFVEGNGTVNLVSNQAAALSGDIFHNLKINKAGSTVTLTQGANVAVNGLLQVQNGSLKLNNGSSCAALGSLSILDGAGLNMQPPSGTAELRVHGNVIDQNAIINESQGLFAGTDSRITFAGSADQELMGGYSTRDFHKVLVQKTGGAVLPNYGTLVKDEFRVISGEWSLAQAGISREFRGDFIIEQDGVFSVGTAPVIFSGNSSTMQIEGQATFGTINITKNEGESLTLAGNVSLNGTTDINLSGGSFSLGGYQLQMFGNLTATDLLLLPAGSTLNLLDGSSVSISGDGKLLAIGSYEFPAKVSSPDGYYGFSVGNYGSIGGQWCIIERMNSTGIAFSMRSSLDPDNPPTNFTFRDGESGGSLLRISWLAIGSNINTFYNAHFPVNTWGSLSNVRKGNSQGSVRFENASGGFSGEAFEDDDYGTIHWLYSAPPATPLNVQIVLLTDAVQISWDAVADADAYNVYRSFNPSDPDSWEQAGTTEDTYYADESVIVYPKAFYRVRAVRGGG
jgi:M6 family metalloprotease-like protein